MNIKYIITVLVGCLTPVTASSFTVTDYEALTKPGQPLVASIRLIDIDEAYAGSIRASVEGGASIAHKAEYSENSLLVILRGVDVVSGEQRIMLSASTDNDGQIIKRFPAFSNFSGIESKNKLAKEMAGINTKIVEIAEAHEIQSVRQRELSENVASLEAGFAKTGKKLIEFVSRTRRTIDVYKTEALAAEKNVLILQEKLVASNKETNAGTLPTIAVEVVPSKPPAVKTPYAVVTAKPFSGDDWLFNLPEDVFTIQVASVSSRAAELSVAKRVPNSIILPASKPSSAWKMIMHGSYISKEDAQVGRDQLVLKGGIIKRVSGLRSKRCQNWIKADQMTENQRLWCGLNTADKQNSEIAMVN